MGLVREPDLAGRLSCDGKNQPLKLQQQRFSEPAGSFVSAAPQGEEHETHDFTLAGFDGIRPLAPVCTIARNTDRA
jgi:hypothetical protein